MRKTCCFYLLLLHFPRGKRIIDSSDSARGSITHIEERDSRHEVPIDIVV